MAAGWLKTEAADGILRVVAGGAWETAALGPLDAGLRRLVPGAARDARIDLGAVESLDTAGAWVLYRTVRDLRAHGVAAEIVGARPAHATLIERIARSDQGPAPRRPHPNPMVALLERTGRALVHALAEMGGLLSFLGVSATAQVRVWVHPRRIRFIALFSQIERTGLDAMPIVGLLAFLIGVVTAYQGADQLRRFGAEIFTVNLVGISVLREMGVLLAAIMVAGRSGSAFAAQIGTMQVNEEVDAMRTIGLDPIEVLVLPRVWALVIALPLLTVWADLAGVVGGQLMAWATLDIPAVQFYERVRNVVPLWAFWVGMIKAPVFGLLIALIGCREGLHVSGSAESVGLHTTRAVVFSIFLVIVADAAFSIFFSAVHV
jgi:phospholipid/cholesterol/gamma-HCH transport system permease protein